MIISFLLFSCSTSEQKSTDTVEKKLNKTETINQNEQVKNKQTPSSNNKKPTKKNIKGNYYQILQKEISLTNVQLNKLKVIAKKYDRKLKSLPKNNTQLVKRTKAQKQEEIKRMLGEKLYLRKVEFDQNL